MADPPAPAAAAPSTMLSERAGLVCVFSAAAFGLALKYAWERRFDQHSDPLCQMYVRSASP